MVEVFAKTYNFSKLIFEVFTTHQLYLKRSLNYPQISKISSFKLNINYLQKLEVEEFDHNQPRSKFVEMSSYFLMVEVFAKSYNFSKLIIEVLSSLQLYLARSLIVDSYLKKVPSSWIFYLQIMELILFDHNQPQSKFVETLSYLVMVEVFAKTYNFSK